MAQYQVNEVQITFDDEDIYIEYLENEIEELERMINSIEQKYYQNESLRFMCLHNTLLIQLEEKQRELDAVSMWCDRKIIVLKTLSNNKIVNIYIIRHFASIRPLKTLPYVTLICRILKLQNKVSNLRTTITSV